jgi:MYXO-CTERM domain-containing protein
MSHKLKLFGAAGPTVALVLGLATPALAHVTTDPDSAPQGGEITLGFRVPNEEANANTVQVEVDVPTDHPLLGIDVEPLPGWTAKVSQITLNPPVQTDDGPVSQAVNQIIWTAPSGGGIAPGQFQRFFVLVQTLPKDVNQVVFKALQTYSDGNIVRWIDPVTAGKPAPDHPTPILTLTAPPDTTATSKPSGSPTQAAIDTSKLATKSSVDSAQTIGVIGIVVGALGLAVAAVGVARRRRAPAAPPG